MNQRPCRRELLHQINAISFALLDTQLYLDTHPCDAKALAYFKEHSELRKQLLLQYARLYGPLTVDVTTESCQDKWNWVDEPWPWQEGGC